jgi:hypothetical protein
LFALSVFNFFYILPGDVRPRLMWIIPAHGDSGLP